MCIHTHTWIYICITGLAIWISSFRTHSIYLWSLYIYIYIERERERERWGAPTPRNAVRLENLIQRVHSQWRNSQHSMKPGGSSPRTQQFASCPCPLPGVSSYGLPSRSIWKLSFHLCRGLLNDLLLSHLPSKPIRLFRFSATRVTYSPSNSVVIFGEEWKAWSSPLCGFLQLPYTSFLVGPYIFLSTLFSNILSLCCSLTVKGQVSRPYKTTGHIGKKNKENMTESWRKKLQTYPYVRSVLKQPSARRHVVQADRWPAVATTRPDKARPVVETLK